MRSTVAGPWEVDNDQLRAVIEADPLTRADAQELVPFYGHSHLKRIGKMKKACSGSSDRPENEVSISMSSSLILQQ